MSMRLQVTGDRESLDAQFDRPVALGSPAFKRLHDVLTGLRNTLGALSVTLTTLEGGDLEYSCVLRDGREWRQRLYLDGRVEFGRVTDPWTKDELAAQIDAGAALLEFVQTHKLLSLEGLWEDPPPRDGEVAEVEA